MPQYLSADEAAALLRPHDALGLGLGPANPPALLEALGRRRDWESLTIGGALLLGLYDVLTHPAVEFRSGFFGPVERAYAQMGHRIELVPGGFRQFGPILDRLHPRMVAVAARVDADAGVVNLSLHHGATYEAIVAAGRDPQRLLVVEANDQLPWTASYGPEFTNEFPLDLVDVVIEASAPPFTLEEEEPSDDDLAVAEEAVRHIASGATLQTGIGTIPSVVATRLAEGAGEGYGIHSEMFTDGLRRLHAAGKVTNAHKGIFEGRSITTFALGSAALYEFLDHNDEVAFLPVSTVNDSSVIARNRHFVSINGAISVDLYGQIVAEAIDGRQISGVGGHEDFVAGAEFDVEDTSLICMTSTAMVRGERRSRIVARHPKGTIVSTPRQHTGLVVTEFGTADLRGLTVAERARCLSEVAHPEHRTALRSEARSFGRPPVATS